MSWLELGEIVLPLGKLVKPKQIYSFLACISRRKIDWTIPVRSGKELNANE